jgi:hypothetical protein
MASEKAVKCSHPLCSCVTTSGKYCSAECEATEKTPEIACACPHTGCKGNPRRRRLDERKLGGAMLVVENDIQE